MKRPFLIVALLYLSGIVAGEWFPVNPTLLFCCALGAAFAAMFLSKHRPLALAAALVLTGWFNICRQSAVISPHDLRLLLGTKPELLCARGTLAASPKERLFERDDKEMWRSTAVLEVSQIKRGDAWRSAHGRISIGTPGVLDEQFFDGQMVEVSGVVHPPGLPMAPGLFDARAYLQRQGIYFQLSVGTNDWKVLEADPPRRKPIATRFHDWVKQTLARGLPVDDQAVRLTWTLMLDWRAPMTQTVQEPFVKAGTFHIFAVDGLRIGMISAILILFFKVLRIPRQFSGFAVIFAIWFYTGLTGFPASAIRASIMMSVIIVGWAIRRPGDLLNSLFAAAFIILLWDPQQLFLPGFQLSFGVVFYIAVLLKPMERLRTRLFAGDPFLPDKLKWHPGPKLRWIGRFGYETFAMSLAAWLGAMPLAACYFHIFNWISLPANCLVVPMTILALASNLASLAVAPFWPFGAELFNHSSWLLMNWIIGVSKWFASLPTACFNIESPSVTTFVLYLAVLGLIGTGWIFQSARKRLAWTALIALTVLWLGQQAYLGLQTRLHVIPLEGGHAVFVQSKFRSNLLIDSGSARTVEMITAPFLRAQGVNWISTFCLSDASQRQMGGAAYLSTNFHISKVAFSPARARSPGYNQFISGLEKTPNCRRLVEDGSSVLGWTVLNPVRSTRVAPADDNAIVLSKEIGGLSVLFVSDLGRAGQAKLLARHPGLHADMVIGGLPARDEPLSSSFLDAIKPKLIVIADSDYPAPRRAPPSLRERLAAQSAPVLFCHDTGALTVVFGPFGWHVETADGQTISIQKRALATTMPGEDAGPESTEEEESALPN